MVVWGGVGVWIHGSGIPHAADREPVVLVIVELKPPGIAGKEAAIPGVVGSLGV